jgi:hypothetical protein
MNPCVEVPELCSVLDNISRIGAHDPTATAGRGKTKKMANDSPGMNGNASPLDCMECFKPLDWMKCSFPPWLDDFASFFFFSNFVV